MQPKKRRCPSWARLIAKVFQADPLVQTLRWSVVYITDTVAIRRIWTISASARRRSHLLRSVGMPVDDERRQIGRQPSPTLDP
jgi:hypothetical protein